MITYSEFFLFVALGIAVGYACYWRHQAKMLDIFLKMMVTDPKARDKIVSQYEQLKREEA